MKLTQWMMIGIGSLALLACKEQSANQTEQSANQTEQTAVSQQLPLISAKSESFLQTKKCFKNESEYERCYQLDVYQLVTNIDWLNHYFEEELRAALAFADIKRILSDEKQPTDIEKLSLPEAKQVYLAELDKVFSAETAPLGYWYEYRPHFIAQRGQLAMFVSFSDLYNGGAHNIYSTRYFNFDLVSKKLLKLDDILLPNKQAELMKALEVAYGKYLMSIEGVRDDQVQQLLKERQERWELSLTNNFTFTAQGIVFSYLPYELGPFYEGQIDLLVPYWVLIDVLKPEYTFNQTKLFLDKE